MHTFIQIGNTWFPTDNGWLDPDAEPTDPGSRKLAVVPSLAGTSVGMPLLPMAMPTMAKMMWKPRDMAIWERAARRSSRMRPTRPEQHEEAEDAVAGGGVLWPRTEMRGRELEGARGGDRGEREVEMGGESDGEEGQNPWHIS